MARTVVSNHEVPHLWYHQTQDHAHSDNLRFDGPTIYSYAQPIARHVTGTRGRKAVLVTTGHWSVTTTGHLSRVRSAIPSDATVFHVYDVCAKPSAQLDTLAKGIKTLALDVKRRRNKGDALAALRGAIDHANRYAEVVGSRRTFGVPDSVDLASAEALAEKYRKQEAARTAAQERRAKAAALASDVEARAALALWLAGESNYGYARFSRFAPEYGQAFLRVNPADATEVQTSMGATFPVAHCERLIRLVRSGVPYRHNGHTEYAGVFRVDEIDAQGNVKAGCHTVTRAECERFAAVLGL